MPARRVPRQRVRTSPRALGAPATSGPEELLAAGYRRWGRGAAASPARRLRAARLGQRAGRGADRARPARGALALPERRGRRSLLRERDPPSAGAAAQTPGPRSRERGSLGGGQQPPGRSDAVRRASAGWTPARSCCSTATGPGRSATGHLASPGRWTCRSRSSPSRYAPSLECAVQRRIDTDGETGVLMSGGLDSASVAAVVAAQAPGRVSAYAGVFPEHPGVDESGLIEELRGALALPGVTAEVRAGGLLASALESLDAWEVPLLGWGDFWTLPLLRAAASAGVTVTLGGDGGDELFGPRVYVLADRLRTGHPREALELALELPGARNRPPRRQVARVLGNWALTGAVPYMLHNALRRPFAAGRAPDWMRRETVLRFGRIRRPVCLEAPGRSALVGSHRAWPHPRGRGDRHLRAPAPTGRARRPGGPPSAVRPGSGRAGSSAATRGDIRPLSKPAGAAREHGRPAARLGAAAPGEGVV